MSIWRNWVGEHYEHVPTRAEGYFNSLIVAAVFASDWKPGKRDAAAMGLPNTFFCGERGLMVTRSDWSPDAVYLQLHCRQDLGGHTSAERNSFILCALGRIWGRLQTMSGGSGLGKSNETRFHSCITIDDVGQIQNASGSNMTPGRMVAFADAPEQAIALVNAVAPEHLQLMDEASASRAADVRTAGCVFVGPEAATAFGDYIAGSNHILPTDGTGKSFGPVSPVTFRRSTARVSLTPGSATALSGPLNALAKAEGLPVHGLSAMARREDEQNSDD